MYLTRYTHAQGPRAHGVVVFSLMRSLNFADGVSGVNHSLAGGELSLLLILLYQVLSTFFRQSESMSLNSLSR